MRYVGADRLLETRDLDVYVLPSTPNGRDDYHDVGQVFIRSHVGYRDTRMDVPIRAQRLSLEASSLIQS